ncbi:hypothetical protein [Dyella terrae]|uniref:hypothetical protein n=1 Tax=Dyella terrae TaxID=522259 RepID=UPI001EFDC599|nr:hypothetical protein [Dyella terrae]ULU24128.1 hypothetical protein DYST_01040 [Dyella terrae]
MLDLPSGIVDFGDGETLAVDSELTAFEQTRAYARLTCHPNPHVPDLLTFQGWQEAIEAHRWYVALTFYRGRGAGMSMHLANGPLSPLDWNRVSEALLKREVQLLVRMAQAALGRAADHATFAHAPAFGGTWELPWGQLSAHGEPRSYTAGIYLTPRH